MIIINLFPIVTSLIFFLYELHTTLHNLGFKFPLSVFIIVTMTNKITKFSKLTFGCLFHRYYINYTTKLWK